MAQWLRFEHQGQPGFGKLLGDRIELHDGDLFAEPRPTGATLGLSDVTLLPPCAPTKMLGLWNNFHLRAQREGLAPPAHPLYFCKLSNSYLAGGQTIRRPQGYHGALVFEGELGIVIGRRCERVTEAEADEYIFGYTCVNDVTARDILRADASFDQWTRAKGFDTFGVFGPVIAAGLDVATLVVRSLLDGEEKQNYPVSDMFASPRQIVSQISHDMTLCPGDVIACGTSVGAGPMPPDSEIAIVIDGIGALINRIE